MNICFISNFSKTVFFEEITIGLKADIYWIAVNTKIYAHLTEKYGKKHVLLINKNFTRKNKIAIGEYKLNELVHGDRLLRNNPEDGVSFLKNIQEPIFSFLKTNNISFVFGEMTWAHELLIHRIINDKLKESCIYLNPHTVRIPNGRFAFFSDEFQSKFYEKAVAPPTGPFTIQKPDYLAKNDKIRKSKNSISGLSKRLLDFLRDVHYEPNDPTRMNRRQTLKLFFRELYNKKYYQFLIKKERTQTLENKKFFLFTLHKQPEASIDVLGRYYEDQLTVIKNLWRILPNDVSLVIKEHTNALGDRRPGFYKTLMRLKNVILIDEKTDTNILIKKAEAVFTISGTVAYEAALANKHSFTFAPCFFNGFGNCYKIDLETLKHSKNFSELINICQANNNSIEDLKKFVLESSYEGKLGDPVFNPEGMASSNIQNFSKALNSVIYS